jgi:hypothetical protein
MLWAMITGLLLSLGVQPALGRTAAGPSGSASWQRYVLAPASRNVAPLRIVASHDVVGAQGLLAPGATVQFSRRLVAGASQWPTGTTATASSQMDAGHGPSAAIDDNLDTAWAGTPNAYPYTLTVRSPAAVQLPGITLKSTTDGYPVAFTVDSWNGSAWVRQASVTGNTELTRAVAFPRPVSTSQVRITITKAWAKPDYPIFGSQIAYISEVVPGLVTDPYVELDFGKDVAGQLRIQFASASNPAPEVRIATSETLATLEPRSDYTRTDYGTPPSVPPTNPGPGTDQVVPQPSGGTWTDTNTCQVGTHVCATGLRGFRYVRIYLGAAQGDAPYVARYGWANIQSVHLEFTPYLGTPATYKGYFLSSDDLLNRTWYASIYSTELTTTVFDKSDTDPRGCVSSYLQGKVVYEDGAKRDRCWYGGGSEMQTLATYLSHPDPAPIRNMLIDAAIHQSPNGNIPGSPCCTLNSPSYGQYPGGDYWVRDLFEYTAYSGDLSLAQQLWPNLVKLLNTWLPTLMSADGTVLDNSYWTAVMASELRQAALISDALGGTYAANSAAWRQRADSIAATATAHLWDPSFGAFLNSSPPSCHELGYNALAITGGMGVAAPLQTGIATAAEASAFLRRMPVYAHPYGYTNGDPTTPPTLCNFFGTPDTELVYGQDSAEAAWAAFNANDAQAALNDLRSTYGWQLSHDPYHTLWEGYVNGSTQGFFGRYFTSYAHNLGVGAAADLTNGLLGVAPAGIGFSSYNVIPHPGDVAWARGRVPTPHGPIDVAWQHDSANQQFTLHVTAPTGTTGEIAVPTFGHAIVVTVNGHLAWNGQTRDSHGAHSDGSFVYLENMPSGSYDITSHATSAT